MKIHAFLSLAVGAVAFAAAPPPRPLFVSPALVGPPKEGFVTNAATAIKIALAVYEPIHGAGRVEIFRPYHARLTNGIWVVEGSFRRSERRVAIAEIAKEDGRVLRLEGKLATQP
jgi:hypothetical protein